MLFVASNLPHQKRRIKHDACNDQRHQQNAENQQKACSPVQQNPADVKKDRDQNETSAKRDEKRDRTFPAGSNHTVTYEITCSGRARWLETADALLRLPVFCAMPIMKREGM